MMKTQNPRASDVSQESKRLSESPGLTSAAPGDDAALSEALPPEYSDDGVIALALEHYAPDGEALRERPAHGPVASIYDGAAGVAYALYRIARRRGDPHVLDAAHAWTQRAFALATDASAFYDTTSGPEREMVNETSLLHSMSGLHCVRALVGAARGDADATRRGVAGFLEHAALPCAQIDLTLGIASLLIGCAELVDAMPVGAIEVAAVRRRGDQIARDLVAVMRDEPIATSSAMPMLGAAHGWAGLLFAVLRWSNTTAAACDPVVVAKLAELAELAEPHAGGVRWPINNATASSRYWFGWCNGTAGHVLLLALAHRVLGHSCYAELAERAACSMLNNTLRLGSICCGLSGVAYAYGAVYRITGAAMWLERARTTARRALADPFDEFELDSLYRGRTGAYGLLDDLQDPMTAAQPLMEPACS